MWNQDLKKSKYIMFNIKSKQSAITNYIHIFQRINILKLQKFNAFIAIIIETDAPANIFTM